MHSILSKEDIEKSHPRRIHILKIEINAENKEKSEIK